MFHNGKYRFYRQKRLPAEPRYCQLREFWCSPVKQSKYGCYDFVLHAADGKILIAIRASKITLLCGQYNKMHELMAERHSNVRIE